MHLLFSRVKQDAEISRQAMEACEHIISEMGAELHDDLIQRLSVFRLSLDRLERALPERAQAEALLLGMKGDFQEVIQSVRTISRKFMPVRTEDSSFEQGIALLCQNMERPGTGNVHFESAGVEQKITPLAETYLSRVVQELIHNAYKHSSAWHVWVRFSWQSGLLVIEVEDDGTGFSKVPEFIGRLKKKYNTLKMRSEAIGALIHFSQGKSGLLARVEYSIKERLPQGP